MATMEDPASASRAIGQISLSSEFDESVLAHISSLFEFWDPVTDEWVVEGTYNERRYTDFSGLATGRWVKYRITVKNNLSKNLPFKGHINIVIGNDIVKSENVSDTNISPGDTITMVGEYYVSEEIYNAYRGSNTDLYVKVDAEWLSIWLGPAGSDAYWYYMIDVLGRGYTFDHVPSDDNDDDEGGDDDDEDGDEGGDDDEEENDTGTSISDIMSSMLPMMMVMMMMGIMSSMFNEQPTQGQQIYPRQTPHVEYEERYY